MKATITVANAKQPKGWKEEILLPGVEDEKTGREHIDKVLKKFNSDLRGDQPRKLLDVTFQEMAVEECRKHGYMSYPEEDCPFSENRKERMDAWWGGWREADRDEQSEDDEEEEEPDEDEEDE
jgi:ribosome modulation factor